MMNAIEPCESKTEIQLPVPIGWYSVARGRDIGKGEVKRVYAFDRELALFRTREGRAVLLDAYCPHMGAHMGFDGRVVGESLRCPFHGWRFGADGVCEEIPYCDEIPERARVRAWHVSEVNGEIMVWYHPRAAEPTFPMPVVEELASDEWTEPQYWEFTVPTHVQNIAENVCDPVHFRYVHRMPDTPPSEVTIAEDGRVLTLTADSRDTAATHPHILTAVAHNPGLAIVRENFGPNAEMLVYSTAQPTSPNETHMRWSLTVRKEIVDLIGDDAMHGIKDGISDDYPIWRNKVYRPKPVFCKGDNTLVTFRKWVSQFYID